MAAVAEGAEPSGAAFAFLDRLLKDHDAEIAGHRAVAVLISFQHIGAVGLDDAGSRFSGLIGQSGSG